MTKTGMSVVAVAVLSGCGGGGGGTGGGGAVLFACDQGIACTEYNNLPQSTVPVLKEACMSLPNVGIQGEENAHVESSCANQQRFAGYCVFKVIDCVGQPQDTTVYYGSGVLAQSAADVCVMDITVDDLNFSPADAANCQPYHMTGTWHYIVSPDAGSGG